jgi:hypothetical protein
MLSANSPQAKGRIALRQAQERVWHLQDRMVKELRLAGVSSMAAANAWLPGFITAYNTRFGRDLVNAKDLHRPLAQADDLDEIPAWREKRTVTCNLTLHYDRMMLLLDPTPLARGLARKKVEVVNYPDGRFARLRSQNSRISLRSSPESSLSPPAPVRLAALCSPTPRSSVWARSGLHLPGERNLAIAWRTSPISLPCASDALDHGDFGRQSDERVSVQQPQEPRGIQSSEGTVPVAAEEFPGPPTESRSRRSPAAVEKQADVVNKCPPTAQRYIARRPIGFEPGEALGPFARNTALMLNESGAFLVQCHRERPGVGTVARVFGVTRVTALIGMIKSGEPHRSMRGLPGLPPPRGNHREQPQAPNPGLLGWQREK